MAKKIGLGLLLLFMGFACIVTLMIERVETLERLDFILDLTGFLIVLFSILIIGKKRG